MTQQISVNMTFDLTMPEDYSEQDAVDYLRWRSDVGNVDVEAALLDISAMKIIDAREVQRPMQPGDLVEKRNADLDPREVVSVGRDFITLDILGEETVRVPKDNYRVVVPAEGVL